jgi:hypothetical protein
MLQNHHADKAETRSAMRVHSIKGTVLLGETMNYDINVPFSLVHYFRNNSSWLEEWGQLHFLTWTYAQIILGYIKDRNHVKIALSLQELKDIIWAEINNIYWWDIYFVSRNISRIRKACLKNWGQYQRL